MPGAAVRIGNGCRPFSDGNVHHRPTKYICYSENGEPLKTLSTARVRKAISGCKAVVIAERDDALLVMYRVPVHHSWLASSSASAPTLTNCDLPR